MSDFEDESQTSKLIKMGLSLNEDERDFLTKVLIIFEQKELAYKLVANLRQKFELAIELQKVNECIALCEQLKESIFWKKLGDLAMIIGNFPIAESSFLACQDTNSLLMLATCLGDKALLEKTASIADE